MTENEKQEVRAEAVMEFAEKLKKYYTALKGRTSTNMVCYTVDVIAKEITGGDRE